MLILVRVAPLDASPAKVIATGTSAVTNGTLGQFDPTLLADGVYNLELSAVDVGGHVSTVDNQVSVTGNLKLGNFNISFTDMTVPVAGIPITVSRTYGWHLNLEDAQLEVDAPFNPYPNLFPPYSESTRAT